LAAVEAEQIELTEFGWQTVNMADIVVFDITPTTAKEAAEEGCSLFDLLLEVADLHKDKLVQSDIVLFAADLRGDLVTFGLPTLEVANKYSVITRNKRGEYRIYVPVRYLFLRYCPCWYIASYRLRECS
jgi:hypothetical protein